MESDSMNQCSHSFSKYVDRIALNEVVSADKLRCAHSADTCGACSTAHVALADIRMATLFLQDL